MRIRYLALGLFLALGLVVSPLVNAGGPPPQTLKGKLTKSKKLSKKKKTANGVVIKIDNANSPEKTVPYNTMTAEIGLTKNIAINTGKVPKCTSDLSAMDTETARAECSSSQVSVNNGTSATLAYPVAVRKRGSIEVPAEMTVFNGPEDNQVTIHVVVPGEKPVIVPLVGNIANSAGSAYGKSIVVDGIPPVPIRNFYMKLKKKKFITANCKDKTPDFKVKNTYYESEGVGPYTSKAKSKCKRKR